MRCGKIGVYQCLRSANRLNHLGHAIAVRAGCGIQVIHEFLRRAQLVGKRGFVLGSGIPRNLVKLVLMLLLQSLALCLRLCVLIDQAESLFVFRKICQLLLIAQHFGFALSGKLLLKPCTALHLRINISLHQKLSFNGLDLKRLGLLCIICR